MKLLSLNHYWRICAAGISYTLFGLGAFLPGAYITLLSVIPMNEHAKQRRVRKVIQRLCRFYVDIMQFLGLMTYRVEGDKPLQLKGHIVVANHSMLIDALFVLGYVDNICCVVKAPLARNPFTRIPVRLAGYITNDDADIVGTAIEKLKAGENILIFPEGTRNTSDLELNFKRGASNLAVISGAPVLPIVLCCMPRALGKGEKWWQLPEVKSQIVMRFLPTVDVDQRVDTSLPRPLQYRHFTQSLRDLYHGAVSQVVSG